MKRNDTMEQLALHREQLHQQFGVVSLALFGPMAQDKTNIDSDSDGII